MDAIVREAVFAVIGRLSRPRHSGASRSDEPGIQKWLGCHRLVIPGCAEGAGPESVRPLAPWRNGFRVRAEPVIGRVRATRWRAPEWRAVAWRQVLASPSACLTRCIPPPHNLPVVPICRTSLALRCRANQNDALACLAPIKRGGSRSSRTLGAGCDGRTSPGAIVSATSGVGADGEVVWSWRSDAGAKLVKTPSASHGRRWQKSMVTEEITYKP
jgi:hypothetical protein